MASVLSECEEVVLELIGQQTHQWYNSGDSGPVIQAAAKSYSAENVQLALDLLANRGYIIISYGHLLQLTPDGYYAYAGDNVPGFADLIQRIESELCQNNRTNNRDIAKKLQTEQVTVDYIFDMMFQTGALDNGNHGKPLAAAGPIWYIMKLSPEFRLKCREMQQS